MTEEAKVTQKTEAKPEEKVLPKIKIVKSETCPRCNTPLQLSDYQLRKGDRVEGVAFCSNPVCVPKERADRLEGWAVSRPIPADAIIIECTKEELEKLREDACKLSCQGQAQP